MADKQKCIKFLQLFFEKRYTFDTQIRRRFICKQQGACIAKSFDQLYPCLFSSAESALIHLIAEVKFT